MERNAQADLEICQRATRGYWAEMHSDGIQNIRSFYGDAVTPTSIGMKGEDITFICTAREALPYWINEAMQLGAVVEKLLKSDRELELAYEVIKDASPEGYEMVMEGKTLPAIYSYVFAENNRLQKVVEAAKELVKICNPSESRCEACCDNYHCRFEGGTIITLSDALAELDEGARADTHKCRQCMFLDEDFMCTVSGVLKDPELDACEAFDGGEGR